MSRDSLDRRLDSARALVAGLPQPSAAARRFLSLGLSAAILAYLLHAVSDIGWREVIDVLPASMWFYVALALSYMATPLTEYWIFRRWWPITPRALSIFSKKRVLNDAVLGYSGDAYLFMWARRALGAREVGAGPLAAVKDVAITSALAGNAATLLMLAAALLVGGGPAVEEAFEGNAMKSVGIGFVFVMSISVMILLFSSRVMSLSMRENAIVFAAHCARLLFASALLLVAWWMALPEVAFGTWLVLGALRMVVTRLPFVPNKELLFAAIGVTLTGDAAPEVAALMAAAGALHMVGHVLAYAGASIIEGRGPGVRDVAPAGAAAGS